MEAALYEAYRESKRSLQRAIIETRIRAWEELLETLERDPWGRPVTESLHPWLLEEVVTTLFSPPPADGGMVSPPGCQAEESFRIWEVRDDEVPGVTGEELAGAVRRMGAKNTAPGFDSIPGRAWVLALSVLGDCFRQLFDLCLRRERFL